MSRFQVLNALEVQVLSSLQGTLEVRFDRWKSSFESIQRWVEKKKVFFAGAHNFTSFGVK